MSSSNDIEKLFEHFGGDANAYQEIGRENEARTARTRWPLLVTLDLTQPTIPEIGPRREAQAQVNAEPAADQDSTPKDLASVTRAKAPLFTRSHRRDIPPVVAAAQPAAPAGASRFGVPSGAVETGTQAGPSVPENGPLAAQAASVAQLAPAAPAAFAQPEAAAADTSDTPIRQFALHAAVPPAVAAAPFSRPFRKPAMPTDPAAPVTQTPYATPTAPIPNAPPNWARALAPAHTQAPSPAYATAPAPARPTMTQAAPARTAYAPATPHAQQPASILGKLFAAQLQAASQQSAAPAAATGEAAPLQSVFDRLRGTASRIHAPLAAAPAGASRATAPGVSPSWLLNGPRHS